MSKKASHADDLTMMDMLEKAPQPIGDSYPVIDFSYNWNNKLDCKAFTTLRLANERYVEGRRYAVRLKGELKGDYRIEKIKTIFLNQINEYISYLDTGYSVADCKNVIKKMYPKIDVDIHPMFLILLVKED